MSVDRCVCLELPFPELLARARAEGLGFAGLQALTGCSTGCGLCEPYMRRLLATGDVRQPVMSAAEAERWRHAPDVPPA